MPHEYHTNAEQVWADMQATIATFGFTSTWEGRNLGEGIVDEIISGIADRSIEKQCDGSGMPWPPNKPPTWRRKYRQWGEVIINKDTGQMLSAQSLRGTTKISQFQIVMDYGTNEPQPETMAPLGKFIYTTSPTQITHVLNAHGGSTKHPKIRGVLEGDRESGYVLVTDVDKAYYASIQGRSFYELDDEICNSTFSRFSAALGAHLANPGR